MPFSKDYHKLAQHKISIIEIIDKYIKYIINNIDYPLDYDLINPDKMITDISDYLTKIKHSDKEVNKIIIDNYLKNFTQLINSIYNFRIRNVKQYMLDEKFMSFFDKELSLIYYYSYIVTNNIPEFRAMLLNLDNKITHDKNYLLSLIELEAIATHERTAIEIIDPKDNNYKLTFLPILCNIYMRNFKSKEDIMELESILQNNNCQDIAKDLISILSRSSGKNLEFPQCIKLQQNISHQIS